MISSKTVSCDSIINIEELRKGENMLNDFMRLCNISSETFFEVELCSDIRKDHSFLLSDTMGFYHD